MSRTQQRIFYITGQWKSQFSKKTKCLCKAGEAAIFMAKQYHPQHRLQISL